LGRPWQFDLDATHGGRSNTYSFIHKGVHHILKPMKESDIKAHVFAGATRKKSGVHTTSKPRTALVQGEGNDMATTIGSKVLYDGSESVCKDLTGFSIKVGSILINWKEKKEGEKEANDHGKRCMKIAAVSPPINEVTQLMSKPRTALFKGGEDDESKVHQINSVVNVEDSEYKAAAMSRKHSFIGVMYRTKCEVNTRKFIQIGSMQVEC